jgi:NAD(P)-dependent dehydrogenase (short-subunit alcohol dehydrogenase family)
MERCSAVETVTNGSDGPRALEGQVAIVTGAGRGIGRAIAIAFAGAGASVVATDIDEAGVEETTTLVAEAGGTAIASRLDVADGAAVGRTVDLARDTYGRLDVAVNNAGVVDVSPLLDFSLEVWRRAFSINVDGAFSLTLAAARTMIRQKPHVSTGCRGKIINVSSGAADIPRPDFAAYGATKAALNHFSQSAAVALAEHGIATTVMCPTSVADGMWRYLGGRLAETTGRDEAEIVAERLAQTPGGQFETAANVAAIAVFIAAARGMHLNGRRVWTSAFVDARDARAPTTW